MRLSGSKEQGKRDVWIGLSILADRHLAAFEAHKPAQLEQIEADPEQVQP